MIRRQSLRDFTFSGEAGSAGSNRRTNCRGTRSSGRTHGGSIVPSPRANELEVSFQPLLDLAARRCANLLRDGLAALEQKHRRDAADAVAARRVRVFVDVEL